jgi:hypothetical protein
MSDRHTRDRGNLFEHAQKQRPSQPAFHGDCTIDGTTYEIRGWRRQDQLAISLAAPRGAKNTFPPEVFRGALDPAPTKPSRTGARGTKQVDAAAPTPAWSGTIVSDEAAYAVRAFEKQGKSGVYFPLSFERIERPAPNASDHGPSSADDPDDDA